MLKQLKKAALAWESSYASNLGNNIRSIKAFWKLKSNLNIFKQKNYNKESIAKIQNLIIRNDNNLKAIFVELVKIKARKILARAEPYKASNSLQEQIKA